MQANHVRKDIIKIMEKRGGHTAVNLSIADILTALYQTAKYNIRQPYYGDRIFATQKIMPALHATRAHAGFFAKKKLYEEQVPKSQGGLSTAIGSAMASKIDNKEHHTYCITTDSELDWQAIILAGKHRLNNLTLIIDRNNTTKDSYLDIEPLRQKIEAFNWNVIEVDGHNTQHIKEALQEAKNAQKPTAIIAHTTPGKGVKFMENDYEWHDRTPTKEEAKKAIEELRNDQKRI